MKRLGTLSLSLRAFALTLGALLAFASLSSAQEAATLRADTVVAGLWRVSGDENGGVLVLDGPSGALVVDASDLSRVDQIDAMVARLAPNGVRTVITTHYHGDHIGANARWRARGATIYAHERVPVQAAKDTIIREWGDWHRKPASVAALTMVTFRDSLKLRHAGHDIVIYHAPNAHTDGDAMIWFRDLDVIHMGDIVEVGATPFIDWWVGGSMTGMIAACDRALAIAGPATKIVPGHGRVVGRAWLLEYRRMLVTARVRTREAAGRGWSRQRFAASRPFEEFEPLLGSERDGRRFANLVFYGLVEFGK